jgi:hypothetical protein
VSDESKRDTLRVPPDVSRMPAMEVLQMLVNWRFADHEMLRKTHALVQLCAAELETGDTDPRTLAQRLQTAEARADFLEEELARLERATHELRQSVTDIEELDHRAAER